MEQQRRGHGGCISKSLQFESPTVNNDCRPPWRASFGVSVILEDFFKPLLGLGRRRRRGRRGRRGKEGMEGAIW